METDSDVAFAPDQETIDQGEDCSDKGSNDYDNNDGNVESSNQSNVLSSGMDARCRQLSTSTEESDGDLDLRIVTAEVHNRSELASNDIDESNAETRPHSSTNDHNSTTPDAATASSVRYSVNDGSIAISLPLQNDPNRHSIATSNPDGDVVSGGDTVDTTSPSKQGSSYRFLFHRPEKSLFEAYILCIPLGIIGAHHFYLGNKSFGVLYFCSFGLFLVGWIIDIFTLKWIVEDVNRQRKEILENGLQVESFGGFRSLHEIPLWKAYLFALPPVGIMGGHHFAMDRTRVGIAYLITFGLCGLGWISDLIRMPLIVRRHNDEIRRIRHGEPPLEPWENLRLDEAYTFAVPCGILGFHHFYLRRYFFGFMYLVTFGFFGILVLVDLYRMPNLLRRAKQELKEGTREIHLDDAYMLAIPLGFTGAHHFYLRRYGWGLVYLCTLGLGGVGWVGDMFRIPSLVEGAIEMERYRALKKMSCQAQPLSDTYRVANTTGVSTQSTNVEPLSSVGERHDLQARDSFIGGTNDVGVNYDRVPSVTDHRPASITSSEIVTLSLGREQSTGDTAEVERETQRVIHTTGRSSGVPLTPPQGPPNQAADASFIATASIPTTASVSVDAPDTIRTSSFVTPATSLPLQVTSTVLASNATMHSPEELRRQAPIQYSQQSLPRIPSAPNVLALSPQSPAVRSHRRGASDEVMLVAIPLDETGRPIWMQGHEATEEEIERQYLGVGPIEYDEPPPPYTPSPQTALRQSDSMHDSSASAREESTLGDYSGRIEDGERNRREGSTSNSQGLVVDRRVEGQKESKSEWLPDNDPLVMGRVHDNESQTDTDPVRGNQIPAKASKDTRGDWLDDENELVLGRIQTMQNEDVEPLDRESADQSLTDSVKEKSIEISEGARGTAPDTTRIHSSAIKRRFSETNLIVAIPKAKCRDSSKHSLKHLESRNLTI